MVHCFPLHAGCPAQCLSGSGNSEEVTTPEDNLSVLANDLMLSLTEMNFLQGTLQSPSSSFFSEKILYAPFLSSILFWGRSALYPFQGLPPPWCLGWNTIPFLLYFPPSMVPPPSSTFVSFVLRFFLLAYKWAVSPAQTKQTLFPQPCPDHPIYGRFSFYTHPWPHSLMLNYFLNCTYYNSIILIF